PPSPVVPRWRRTRGSPPFAWSAIAVDAPPRPLPGQLRPDAMGRCPHRAQFAINGGCWKRLATDLRDCDGTGDYVYKGACYTPVFLPPRPATSGPADDSP
ncbi:hypothetical protein ACLESO_09625, partial [Pyxidicoccus sp. 3LG]